MTFIKQKIEQPSSLSKSQDKKAKFVPVETAKKQKFIYKYVYPRLKKLNPYSQSLRNKWKKIYDKGRILSDRVDWKKVKKDLVTWFVKISIEGFTANFVTHYLLGFPFTIPVLLAHGIAIHQVVEIAWRFRTPHGQRNPVSKDKHG